MHHDDGDAGRPRLVLEIPAAKARLLPHHIVVSNSIVAPDMAPREIAAVCRSLVDALFACLALEVAPGIYMPAPATAAAAVVQSTTNAEDANDDDDKDDAAASDSARDAIARSMVAALDGEFLPFVMHAMESVGNAAANAAIAGAPLAPELGALFNLRGEMMTLGSLAGCGFGVAGVFVNGSVSA